MLGKYCLSEGLEVFLESGYSINTLQSKEFYVLLICSSSTHVHVWYQLSYFLWVLSTVIKLSLEVKTCKVFALQKINLLCNCPGTTAKSICRNPWETAISTNAANFRSSESTFPHNEDIWLTFEYPHSRREFNHIHSICWLNLNVWLLI